MSRWQPSEAFLRAVDGVGIASAIFAIFLAVLAFSFLIAAVTAVLF